MKAKLLAVLLAVSLGMFSAQPKANALVFGILTGNVFLIVPGAILTTLGLAGMMVGSGDSHDPITKWQPMVKGLILATGIALDEQNATVTENLDSMKQVEEDLRKKEEEGIIYTQDECKTILAEIKKLDQLLPKGKAIEISLNDKSSTEAVKELISKTALIDPKTGEEKALLSPITAKYLLSMQGIQTEN